MSKLPSVTGQQAIDAFGRLGFVVARTRGSHTILKKDSHRYVLTVPVHGSKPIPTGTLRALLRGAGITVEQFTALLRH